MNEELKEHGKKESKKLVKKKVLIPVLSFLGNLVIPILILMAIFSLVIAIYSAFQGIGGSNLKSDQYTGGSALIYGLFRQGYDSKSPKGFPATGNFHVSTFDKHFILDRKKGYPSTAIDFWYDSTINGNSKLKENIPENSSKRIADYDYEYLKHGTVTSKNGPLKYCSENLTVSRPPVPIYSTHSGIVSLIGGENGSLSPFGKSVFLKGEQYATTYAHMQSLNVKDGQQVNAGEILGIMGNTGNSCGITGHHLHYEMLVVKGTAGIDSGDKGVTQRVMRGYNYVTKEIFMQNLLAYGGRKDGGFYKGDHVGINVSGTLSGGDLTGNDTSSDGEMGEFLHYSVEGVKKMGLFQENDFFSKLMVWTIIGREKADSYNKNAKPNFYVLASDGGAGIYQSQHVTDKDLLAKYKQWGGYDGSDGDGLGNGKGQGCGIGTEGRLHPKSTVTKQGLINRGCDLERDVRFMKDKVFEAKFATEIRNKLDYCSKQEGINGGKVGELIDGDYKKGLCIIYAYNSFNAKYGKGTDKYSKILNSIFNMHEDVTKGTNHFEDCVKYTRSTGVTQDNSVINCSYVYQYGLNYVLMKEKGATQLDGLFRFFPSKREDGRLK